MGIRYLDISSWQRVTDWHALAAAYPLVCFRVNEGTTAQYIDTQFQYNRAGAIGAGIRSIIFYHYAYPQYNSAVDSARYFASLVGNIRPYDYLMLDFEEWASQATAQWALDFMNELVTFGYPKNRIVLYAYGSYVADRLQDSRLTAYPLIYAAYVESAPVAPYPWKSLFAWQYTSALSIPSITGASVDGDILLNQELINYLDKVPAGWTDDGKTLTAPNGVKVVMGFRDHVLNYPSGWNSADVPLSVERAVGQVELGYTDGAGSHQFFMYHELGWTTERGVFEISVGREAFLAFQKAGLA